MALDERDLAILTQLQHDAKARTSEIAAKLDIPPTTVHNRIKKMEAEGVIKRYTPVIEWDAIGRKLHALIFVTAQAADKGVDQETLAKQIQKLDGVERVAIITGVHDLMVHVHVPNVRALNHMLVKSLRAMPGIEKTETTIVLDESAERMQLGKPPAR